MSIRLFAPFSILFFALCLPAYACLEDSNPSPKTVSEPLYQTFRDALGSMKMDSFIDRFCDLGPVDKALAMQIFDSAYKGLDPEEQPTLLRMSIMVSDIQENVSWVLESGTIREEDDGWESVGIARFVEHIRLRFPDTQTVLNDAYLKKVETLYKSAIDAVRQKELDANDRIYAAKQTIAEYEKKQTELRWQIERYRDERRVYQDMRQQLESQE